MKDIMSRKNIFMTSQGMHTHVYSTSIFAGKNFDTNFYYLKTSRTEYRYFPKTLKIEKMWENKTIILYNDIIRDVNMKGN